MPYMYSSQFSRRKIDPCWRKTLLMPAIWEREVQTIPSFDAANILEFARQKSITQIFVGHSLHQKPSRWVWGNVIDHLIRSAEGIDVIVYPD